MVTIARAVGSVGQQALQGAQGCSCRDRLRRNTWLFVTPLRYRRQSNVLGFVQDIDTSLANIQAMVEAASSSSFNACAISSVL